MFQGFNERKKIQKMNCPSGTLNLKDVRCVNICHFQLLVTRGNPHTVQVLHGHHLASKSLESSRWSKGSQLDIFLKTMHIFFILAYSSSKSSAFR